MLKPYRVSCELYLNGNLWLREGGDISLLEDLGITEETVETVVAGFDYDSLKMSMDAITSLFNCGGYGSSYEIKNTLFKKVEYIHYHNLFEDFIIKSNEKKCEWIILKNTVPVKNFKLRDLKNINAETAIRYVEERSTLDTIKNILEN